MMPASETAAMSAPTVKTSAMMRTAPIARAVMR